MRLRSIFALAAIVFSTCWIGSALAAPVADSLRFSVAHDYRLPDVPIFDVAGVVEHIEVTAEDRTIATLHAPDLATFAKINRLALAASDEWTPEVVRHSARSDPALALLIDLHKPGAGASGFLLPAAHPQGDRR